MWRRLARVNCSNCATTSIYKHLLFYFFSIFRVYSASLMHNVFWSKSSILCVFYIFLLILPGLQHRQNHGANGARRFHGDFRSEGQQSLQQPFFETIQDPETGLGGRNVTTAEGGKAILLCTIRHLGENNTVRVTILVMDDQVSQIRFLSTWNQLKSLWEDPL